MYLITDLLEAWLRPWHRFLFHPYLTTVNNLATYQRVCLCTIIILYKILFGILACTVLHYLTQGNVNTCPIPVCPWAFTVHPIWCTVQPWGKQEWVVHKCMPLMLTEKWDLQKCYTGVTDPVASWYHGTYLDTRARMLLIYRTSLNTWASAPTSPLNNLYLVLLKIIFYKTSKRYLNSNNN